MYRASGNASPAKFGVPLPRRLCAVRRDSRPGRAGDEQLLPGRPTFRVDAGEVVYFGDLTPYTMVKLADGRETPAMAYSARLEDAKAALTKQPQLASAIRAAELRNEATYSCAAQVMAAYQVPGAPALGPAPPQPDSPAP